MEKQQLIEKTTEALRPFETANLMHTMQTLTLKQIFTNPAVLGVIAIVLFLVRFAIPASSTSEEMSLGSVVPFVVIGAVIGGVIIYFSLVKSD